jgi:hypothetical protein
MTPGACDKFRRGVETSGAGKRYMGARFSFAYIPMIAKIRAALAA